MYLAKVSEGFSIVPFVNSYSLYFQWDCNLVEEKVLRLRTLNWSQFAFTRYLQP